MKHVRIAARIGDDNAPGAENIGQIHKPSNVISADSGRMPAG
ncbi:MAG: hypothetical protein OEZ08_14575 [Betaproteobacteria bacterium]|nr:hypothetical protein [Betaproteobacteria bacterium]